MMGIWMVSRGETSPSSTVPSGKTFLFFFFCLTMSLSLLFYSILLYSVLFFSIAFYSSLFYSIFLFCFFFLLFLLHLFYYVLFYFVLFDSILFCSVLFSHILFCSVLPYRKFQKLPTSPPHVHFTCTPSTNSPRPGCCCRAATR